MAKMKTVFELERLSDAHWVEGGRVSIIGTRPTSKPYVSIEFNKNIVYLKDKDLERFAVNILKALNSKRLKK